MAALLERQCPHNPSAMAVFDSRASLGALAALASTVLTGLEPVPPLEGAVKCTGVLKAQSGRNFIHAEIAIAEEVDCDVAAQLVLDLLVACAFSLQPAPQRRLSSPLSSGNLTEYGPRVSLTHTPAKTVPQPGGPTFLVPVLEEHGLRGRAQEFSQRGGVLGHWCRQKAAVEADGSELSFVLDVRTEHGGVLSRMCRACMRKRHCRDWNASTNQPAHQPVGQNQKRLVRKSTVIGVSDLIHDSNHSVLTVEVQLSCDVV